MRAVLLSLLLASPAFAQDPIGFGLDFGFDREGKSWILAVAPGSAAEQAGMRGGDLILEVLDRPMPLWNEGDPLAAARDSLPAPITILRGADTLRLALDVAPFNTIALYRRSAANLCISGDCVDGTGLWVHTSGKWYEGTFRNGRRHGRGVMTEDDGRVYVGEFQNHDRHGHGLYRWPDNTYWVGPWKKGAPLLDEGFYTDENGVTSPGFPQ